MTTSDQIKMPLSPSSADASCKQKKEKELILIDYTSSLQCVLCFILIMRLCQSSERNFVTNDRQIKESTPSEVNYS